MADRRLRRRKDSDSSDNESISDEMNIELRDQEQLDAKASPLRPVLSEGHTQVGEGNTMMNNPEIFSNKYISNHHHHYYIPPNMDGNIIINCHCKSRQHDHIHKGTMFDNGYQNAQPGAPSPGLSQHPHVQAGHHLHAVPQPHQLKPVSHHPHAPTSSHPDSRQTPQFNNSSVGSEHSRVESTIQRPDQSGLHGRFKSRIKERPSIKSFPFQSNDTNKDSMAESHKNPNQAESATRSENVDVIDTTGQKLRPGDIVEADSCYFIYIGTLEMLGSDRKKNVERYTLDITQPFMIRTPMSGQCKIFSPKERVQRAVSCEGGESPERETRFGGLDFVTWVWTGLNRNEALNKGFVFDLWI